MSMVVDIACQASEEELQYLRLSALAIYQHVHFAGTGSSEVHSMT